jgi:hypothetical protein
MKYIILNVSPIVKFTQFMVKSELYEDGKSSSEEYTVSVADPIDLDEAKKLFESENVRKHKTTVKCGISENNHTEHKEMKKDGNAIPTFEHYLQNPNR